ncbi:MAG: hypothetical protein NC489_28055 [Ruminococcus flavefaciens]|nr:hypothetical protein [Ruminococcus flavefaciens]
MEYISPEENDLFVKALRFLYSRALEQINFEADIDPHLPDRIPPKEPESNPAA